MKLQVEYCCYELKLVEEHGAAAVAVDNSADDCNEVTYHPHYYNDIPHSYSQH